MQGSIDNTRVTCIKWVPGSEHHFVSSHQSGCLYVWDSEQTSRTTGQQNFINHADIQDTVIHIVKPKNKSPILYRWTIGHGAINAFAFSPDSVHIAIASQDGFTRVYDFHKQCIYSRMRSYFGGFLCVCWSPDGKYLATGGEDDLVTVWSFEHKKVISRGEGHKSYISEVIFDPYTTVLPESDNSLDTDKSPTATNSPTLTSQRASILGRSLTEVGGGDGDVTAYRLGSVGQDTQLCLWDLSGDALKLRRPFARTRSKVVSRHAGHQSHTDDTAPQLATPQNTNSVPNATSNHFDANAKRSSVISEGKESISSQSSADKTTGKKDKKKTHHKDKNVESVSNDKRKWKEPMKKVLQFVGVSSPNHHSVGARRCQVFETCNSDDIAPKMDEVNLIEPLVAKKISQERITCLVFREDCVVTATQDGFINTWARPNAELPPDVLADKKSSEATATVPTNPGVSVCVCMCMCVYTCASLLFADLITN